MPRVLSHPLIPLDRAPGGPLEALLSRLDRWLDEPPVVERDPCGHTVWVFDAVGYRVNRRLPGV